MMMIMLTMMVMVMVMIFLATGAASGVLNIEEYQYVLMFRRWASARSASTTETRVGSFLSWQASHKLKLLQTSRAQNHRCVMDNPKQKRGCLVMIFLGVGWGGAQGCSPSSWTSPCSHVPKSPGPASLFVFCLFLILSCSQVQLRRSLALRLAGECSLHQAGGQSRWDTLQ